jgi:hypothetical protein
VDQAATLALVTAVRIVAIRSAGTAANTGFKNIALKARVGDW